MAHRGQLFGRSGQSLGVSPDGADYLFKLFDESEDLSRAFHAYPELGFGFFRYMSKSLHLAYRMIGNMRLPAEEKLLAVLAWIMELLCGKCKNRLLEIPVSYRVFARFTQITPETLSRTLRALQKKGIIDVEKRGIRILRAEALRKYNDVPNN